MLQKEKKKKRLCKSKKLNTRKNRNRRGKKLLSNQTTEVRAGLTTKRNRPNSKHGDLY